MGNNLQHPMNPQFQGMPQMPQMPQQQMMPQMPQQQMMPQGMAPQGMGFDLNQMPPFVTQALQGFMGNFMSNGLSTILAQQAERAKAQAEIEKRNLVMREEAHKAQIEAHKEQMALIALQKSYYQRLEKGDSPTVIPLHSRQSGT